MEFQVEEMETISFDEKGMEENTWKGYAVTKVDDPTELCFECKDKTNADYLCSFLNENVGLSDVMDDLQEWSSLITELSEKEELYYILKEDIFAKEQEIINKFDFNGTYGKNNKDVRKAHLDKVLAKDYSCKIEVEFKIDYLKRRISFLKQLIHTKTVLLELKE